MVECGRYAPGLFAIGVTMQWQRTGKSLALDLGPFWIRVGNPA